MKKQYRITGCLAIVSLLIMLTACKTHDSSAYISSKPEGSVSAFETGLDSNQSDSTDSQDVGADALQDNSESGSEPQGAAASSEDTAESESDSPTSSSPSSVPEAQNTASAHSHTRSSKTVAPTCTAGGYTLKSCACGSSEKTDITSALGHSWGGWSTVKAATQTETGLQRRSCSRCNKTEEKILDKLPLTAADMQQEVLRLVNIERAKEGLASLEYYKAGQSAGDIRAAELKQSFSHDRPNGESCFTALEEAGIRYSAAGENIAAGYRSAEAVVNGWMNSPGHRSNIMNPSFKYLIVGVDDYHWVQLFFS